MRRLNKSSSQGGFSLIELMVGLVIGLLATLVIMQVFSAFEGQKRSTSGGADAQTNGTIALINLQSAIQMAGYGLPMPMADKDNSSLECNLMAVDFDPDSNAATINSTNLFPVSIQDGGGANSDTITIRYSTTAAGAVPVAITDPTNATSAQGLNVVNNIGCGGERTAAEYANLYTGKFNIALITRGATCGFAAIDTQPSTTAGGVSKIRLKTVPAALGALAVNDTITCMGDWRDYTFDIVNNELRRNGQPIVSEVVRLHAQYGVSATANSNAVTAWVDATGVWVTPSVVNRNRIKAVRVVVVLRNGLKEKTEVTTVAPVAWVDSGNTQIAIDVSSLTDWKNYRYRVFGTTIPLRNILWSREAL